VTTTVATAGAATQQRPATTDRAVAENRLGLKLVAPAVIVMLIVTAWPMTARSSACATTARS
jgi:multiple sugar transport system permease protein